MKKKKIFGISLCVLAIFLIIGGLAAIKKPKYEKISHQQVKDYACVASVKSEVYHLPYCYYVIKISSYNLIGFKSYQDAISSGRRPC